jgi:hypothetical protein
VSNGPRLHSSVTAFVALGWSSMAIGVVGIAVVASENHDPVRQICVSLALAAFFAGAMWLMTTRTMPGTPTAPPPESVAEPATATVRRVLAVQVGYAVLITLIVLVAPGPVGIVLGLGVWELATAAVLRRWERRTGRKLLSKTRWATPREFYAR